MSVFNFTTFVYLAVWLLAAKSAIASNVPQFVSHPKRTSGGLHLPLNKQTTTQALSPRGQTTASVGLGDDTDIAYNVMLQVGDVSMPVVIDTGSSDLWVVSDTCQDSICNNGLPLYPQTTFQSDNLGIQLFYGDSTTGTHAFGEVGTDNVSLAGINVPTQFFAAINETNSTVLETQSTGLFGFGFPLNSVIWAELFKQEFPNDAQPPLEKRFTPKYSPLSRIFSRPSRSGMQQARSRIAPYLTRTPFPDLRSLFAPGRKNRNAKRQDLSEPSLADILNSFATNGPLISRLSQGDFAAPQFTITLQRDTVDIGGNVGMLSLGELPPGVSNNSLTWVPVRRYTAEQGGLPSPDDVYPIAWEIPVDNVFIDGQELPQSTLSPGISVTALIDTGNSLIRGPSDVVQSLDTILSNSRRGGGGDTFDCTVPHTMAFQIGGNMFPVDPRDFALPTKVGNLRQCVSNVVSTDPPSDGFLYSWSLGDPFLKSNLVSFYFGNLTHPSADPPRIGFMSTVPSDASQQYQDAIASAEQNRDVLPATTQAPPSAPSAAFTTIIPSAPAVTNIVNSENAPTSQGSGSSGPNSLSSQDSPTTANNNGVLGSQLGSIRSLIAVLSCTFVLQVFI